MSDLADRLREMVAATREAPPIQYAPGSWGPPHFTMVAPEDLELAADELDRLSDENAQVRALYNQHLVRHAAQLDRLSARAAELEAVLREVEWRGTAVLDDLTRLHTCLWCGGIARGQRSAKGHAEGHAPDCRLARLLSPLPEEGK